MVPEKKRTVFSRAIQPTLYSSLSQLSLQYSSLIPGCNAKYTSAHSIYEAYEVLQTQARKVGI